MVTVPLRKCDTGDCRNDDDANENLFYTSIIQYIYIYIICINLDA